MYIKRHAVVRGGKRYVYLRLVQAYVNGSMPYSAFASQWQALLTSSAQSWAAQNHVDLNKY